MINASDDNLLFFIVDRSYVFTRRSTLNDRSAVALVTGVAGNLFRPARWAGRNT
jgi:hypothetical protein